MAMALAAYAGTMLAALVALVVTWQSVIGPPQMEKVRPQPHPVFSVVAPEVKPAQPRDTLAQPQEASASTALQNQKTDDNSDVASAEDAQLIAAKAFAAEKAKRVKQARDQKRKEQLARQRQEQQQEQPYSTALGYDQERDASSAPTFNPFGPRRF